MVKCSNCGNEIKKGFYIQCRKCGALFCENCKDGAGKKCPKCGEETRADISLGSRPARSVIEL